MKHSPSVRTHQMEVSRARVLLDTRGMEPQERVLVSESRTWPISFPGLFIFVVIQMLMNAP